MVINKQVKTYFCRGNSSLEDMEDTRVIDDFENTPPNLISTETYGQLLGKRFVNPLKKKTQKKRFAKPRLHKVTIGRELK